MELVELAFFTENVAKMRRFYSTLLRAEPAAESDTMAIFMVGRTKIFIHQSYHPAEGELPPDNHLALSVADVDAACSALVESGLDLEAAPKDYYWGRSAYLRDPDGQLIELSQAANGE